MYKINKNQWIFTADGRLYSYYPTYRLDKKKFRFS